MDNLLGQDFIHITRIYDLKGSTHNRVVNLSEEEVEHGSGLKVLKDLNFLSTGEKLDIRPHKKNHILQIIEKDAQFLSQNNLMDYSLLFIKSRLPKKRSSTQDDD